MPESEAPFPNVTFIHQCSHCMKNGANAAYQMHFLKGKTKINKQTKINLRILNDCPKI